MQSQFDVVICDRVAPPALTQGNFIFIDTLPVNRRWCGKHNGQPTTTRAAG